MASTLVDQFGVHLPTPIREHCRIIIHPGGVFTLKSGERADIIFGEQLHDIIAERFDASLETMIFLSGHGDEIQSMGREHEFDAAYTSKAKDGPERNRLFALFELKG